MRPRDRQVGLPRGAIERPRLERARRDPVLRLELGGDARERQVAGGEQPEVSPARRAAARSRRPRPRRRRARATAKVRKMRVATRRMRGRAILSRRARAAPPKSFLTPGVDGRPWRAPARPAPSQDAGGLLVSGVLHRSTSPMTGLFAFLALVGVLAAVGFFLSARAAKAELAARAGDRAKLEADAEAARKAVAGREGRGEGASRGGRRSSAPTSSARRRRRSSSRRRRKRAGGAPALREEMDKVAGAARRGARRGGAPGRARPRGREGARRR